MVMAGSGETLSGKYTKQPFRFRSETLAQSSRPNPSLEEGVTLADPYRHRERPQCDSHYYENLTVRQLGTSGLPYR